jgi:hypothetical protein
MMLLCNSFHKILSSPLGSPLGFVCVKNAVFTRVCGAVFSSIPQIHTIRGNHSQFFIKFSNSNNVLPPHDISGINILSVISDELLLTVFIITWVITFSTIYLTVKSVNSNIKRIKAAKN